MRRLLPLLILIAVSVPAGTASAVVHACHATAGPTIVISSARNMTCKAAKREMRRYKGSISKRFTTPRGFTCRRASGGHLGGQWRCAKKARVFRFNFGD